MGRSGVSGAEEVADEPLTRLDSVRVVAEERLGCVSGAAEGSGEGRHRLAVTRLWRGLGGSRNGGCAKPGDRNREPCVTRLLGRLIAASSIGLGVRGQTSRGQYPPGPGIGQERWSVNPA
jgi:hypothetical protein